MTDLLKKRLQSAAEKAERREAYETEYWDREYSGDIELGRAKREIEDLKYKVKVLLDAHQDLEQSSKDTVADQLKSISWNLNRIANVLEEVVPNNKTVGENILRSIRKGARNG